MSRIRLSFLLPLVAATTAGAQLPTPTLSSSPSLGRGPSARPWLAQSTIVATGNPDDPMYRTPLGAGYEGVGFLVIERTDIPTGFVAVCSSALLAGGMNILTAAHCLADANGDITTTRVTAQFINSAGVVESYVAGAASQFKVNPAYTGEVIDAHDIAIVHLDQAPSNLVTRYGLYNGPTTGQEFDVAGFGRRGTGSTGYTTGTGSRRHGYNTFDFAFDDPFFGGFFNGFFGNADPHVLVADFDSGLAANDASCWLASFFSDQGEFCDLGLGAREVGIGPGDSGGPQFINGQVAGVTSFGLTFGEDPDIDNALNGSFGEFAGYTDVQYNRAWLNSVTPEPGSMVLLGTGLLALAGLARRRRSV